MHKYKYQTFMDQLEGDCPPSDFTERETIAFRWVFEEMADERNFLPQYFKDPIRFENDSVKIKCQAAGLSFYDTEENAKRRFEKLKKIMTLENSKKLGTKISTGTIAKNDGKMGGIDKRGHFTLHPYEEADFRNSFTIISDL